MGALFLIARSEIRRRWPALLALALLIGLSGAVVFAGLAGARRAASSVDRFITASATSDLRVDVQQADADSDAIFARIAGIAGVGALVQAEGVLAFPGDATLSAAIIVASSPDPAWLTELDRPRVLAGRLPSTVEEITVNEAAVNLLGLRVGSQLIARTTSQAEYVALFTNRETELRYAGEVLRLDVVGITRLPNELSPTIDVTPLALTAPGFYTRYADDLGGYEVGFLRVAAGERTSDVAARIQEELGAAVLVIDERAAVHTMADDGVRVVVVALLVLAGVAVAGGALFVGQAVARQVGAVAAENATLQALGAPRASRAGAVALAVLPAALLGALFAGATAISISALALFGIPARAEPDPGIHADWAVIVLGVAALVVLAAGWTFAAAWRATGTTRTERSDRRSRVAGILARLGLRPSTVAGARGAFDPGAGRTAAPVRSAITGTAFGFVGVVAALTFAASATRLVDSPDRWGFTWDVGPAYPPPQRDTAWIEPAREIVADEPKIEAAGVASDAYVEVGGLTVVGISLAPIRGELQAAVIEGRTPVSPDEVALGRRTMETLDLRIGDEVGVGSEPAPGRLRVVGTAILPDTGLTSPDEGALFTPAGLEVHQIEHVSSGLVLRYARGADREAIQRRLTDLVTFDILADPWPPASVANLHEVRVVPLALAGLFGLLGIAGVTHALAVSGRRRRHDFAVLEALGFARPQVRAAIRWQAVFTIAAGALVGVPLGLIAGRLAWARVAGDIGVVGDLAAPFLWVGIAVAASLLAALLVATVPGWLATRQPPAALLRTE